ncbi:MAG TPA: hypothetical protein VF382_06060 [Actinomycetota bacterium]
MEEAKSILGYWPVVILISGFAASLASTRAWGRAVMKRQGEIAAEVARRQDETNAHLKTLNDKTYNLHGQVQGVKTAVTSLPCRGSAPLPEQCPEDEG